MILAIITLAIFLSFDNPGFTFTLEPAWYVDQRSSSMVQPVICDLNGDGKKEVVMITKSADDLILKVLSADPPNKDKSKIYTPLEIASVSLSPTKVLKGRNPVALKTGYVDSYDAVKGRSQVIVVVREDWTVQCFDSTLKPLWEKAIAHKTHELDTLINKFQIDEVALFLTPLSISETSNGLIIVGANMKLRDPFSADSILLEEGLVMNENGELEHPEMRQRAALEHFSVYALDARTGRVMWRHDGLDIRPDQYITGLPEFAYKLNMHDLMTSTHHAPSIKDWSIFRRSLIAELPHDWHSTDDTTMRLAHFERQHVGAKTHARDKLPNQAARKTTSVAEKDKKGKVASTIAKAAGVRFTGVETPPLSLTASLPHDAAEHTDHPNVVVMHTSKGIEVIALMSGAPITSLALNKGRSYTDLDGDGIVDTIIVLENELDASNRGDTYLDNEDVELQHCSVMVSSGLPSRSILFTGTVCARSHALQESMMVSPDGEYRKKARKDVLAARNARNPSYTTGQTLPAAISAASPVILKTIDAKTLQVSKSSNMVVAVNTGVVTCYGADGEFKWQTRGGPKWNVDLVNSHSGSGSAILFDSDASRVDSLGKHDNVYAQVLIVGDSKVSLMSRDGSFLASTDLPRKPIAHPIIGDFDSDGVTDVIITTDEAILGYRLEVVQSPRAMLLAIIALCCITAIVFFVNVQLVPVVESGPGSQSNSQASVSHIVKRSLLSLARSTDETHID
jgi:outer membrane protein assembly factor BamB